MCHTFWHMHVVKSRAVKKFNIIMTESRDKRNILCIIMLLCIPQCDIKSLHKR